MELRSVRGRSGLGAWEMTFGAPHSLLRPHVVRYLGYSERTTFRTRREAPRGTVPLIVNLGPPLRLVDPRAGIREAYELGLVAGPTDAAGIVDSGGEQAGLQVDFTPIGAQMFLGVPASEITNRAVALEDLLGADAARLAQRLREAPDWRRRFAIVDAAIGHRFAAAPAVPPDLVWAWQRLNVTGGRLRIAELAAELGCSRKHLSARFAEHIGLPPKTVAGILRFQSAVRALSGGALPLAAVAQRCGYYDQAHLTRDFRRFAGITPTEHLRRSAGDLGVIGD